MGKGPLFRLPQLKGTKQLKLTTQCGIFTIVLITAVMQNASAQVATDFKVGDWAQMRMGSNWYAVTIGTPLNAGSYYVNQGPLALPVNADPNYLRHYQPTAEELKVAKETADAMNNRPKGNGVGAKFGTREPATCPH